MSTRSPVRRARQARPRRPRGRVAAASPLALAAQFRADLERCLDALAHSEARLAYYRQLYEDAPFAQLTLNQMGVVLELNEAAAALLQATVANRPLLVYLEPTSVRTFSRHMARCRAGDDPVISPLRLRRSDGPPIDVDLVSTPGRRPSVGLVYHSMLTEVSNSTRLGRRMANDRQYRQIVETANEGICIVDDQDRITWVNSRFAAMVAGQSPDLIGRHSHELMAPSHARASRDDFAQRRTGRAGLSEVLLQRLDGTRFWASVSTSLLHDDRGRFVGMLRMYTDISDRKALEEARAQMVRHLVDAQEAERRRVARELHDQMGQHLVGFGLALRRLRQPNVTSDEMEQLIARLEGLTQTMSRDVHHLALELRPPSLDDLGLAAALANYADDVGRRAGLLIDLHCQGRWQLDASVETTVYRIIQECLTNVIKHAHARRVSIVIEPRDGQLQAIVEDDGQGFDVDQVLRRDNGQQHLGLSGMKERAALVGGEIEVETRPGAGTTVYLRVPMSVKGKEHHEEAATAAR